MTKITIDGISFQSDSLKHRIYLLHKQNLTPHDIATQLDIYNLKGIELVKRTIRKFKRTQITQYEPNQPIPDNANKILDIEILQEGDNMLLKIKSSKEFEDYLSESKELTTTERLWGKKADGKFYVLKLIDNYLDDINKPVFHKGQINFAVLRLKGISDGLTIEINELLSETQVTNGVRLLLSTYKKFYDSCIRNNKIHIKGEVLLA